jgi:hypothetical protein
MGQAQIARKVVTTWERPEIPGCILPSPGQLITACWASDPDHRPSFEQIIGDLRKKKFKVVPNVNPRETLEFVKLIETWEAKYEEIPE